MLAFTGRGRRPLEYYVSRGTEAAVRWTTIRKAVLHLLWGAGTPLGAYEAAERLSAPGCPVHPTSVYRCLDCLVKARLVLPIITWKKFLISPNPDASLWALLLCRGCRSCTPVDLTDQSEALDHRLERRRFISRICAAECHGVCRACSEDGAAA